MKRITAILLALLFCVAAVSCRNNEGTASASSDPSWNMVSEKKELIVGVYSDRLPLTEESSGSFRGFDIDLMTEAAARLNVTVTFTALDGKDAADALSSGEVDCVCSGYVYTADRNELLTLSDPYLTSRQVLVVKETSKVGDIADLAEKTLGVATGGSAQAALDKSETFRSALAAVKEYETENDVMLALAKGEIDSAAVNETIVRYYIAKGVGLRVLLDSDNNPDVLGSEDYVIAFSRGSSALLKKVQEALATMQRDGVLDELSEKWFSNYLSSADQKASEEAAEQLATEDAQDTEDSADTEENEDGTESTDSAESTSAE